MSTPEQSQIIKFIEELEKRFGDLGGVSCKELIEPGRISSDPLLSELVFSILVWESSIEHAKLAVDAMEEGLIDLNEMRVCTPDELVRVFPVRYPRSLERCQRLISILNAIFRKENKLSLERLNELSKKQVIEYFHELDGLPLFASSRVLLFGMGWHAVPLDEWLTKELKRADILDSSTDIQLQTHRLERIVRANESERFYTLLEHWATDRREEKLSSKSKTSAKS